MKRGSLIIVSTILAVAILFGATMGQTNTAHAASISNSTATLNALIAKVERHVHVVNYHATIDSQLKGLVTQEQFQTAQLAVTTYNQLAVSAQHPSNSHEVSNTIRSSASSSGYWVACMYISNGTMDNIAWAIIFGGGIAAIAGIIVALFTAGWGAAIAIAGVILSIGGAYLLWESDKYWPNGTTWCVNSYHNVWYYVD